MKILSEKDSQLFYKLWLPLLDFVNKKYNIYKEPGIIMATADLLDPSEVYKVSQKLWSDNKLIDMYLEQHKELSDEHQEIVRSWNRHVQSTFILERHLQKGSILISEDSNVYLVSGIVSSWEEMTAYFKTPVMLNATLIPFKDVIISDGIVSPYDLVIGNNAKKVFKDTYIEARNSNKIIRKL